MGSYNLDRLGNNEFENLVQALSTKIFNNNNIVFGSGRDGAREATFDGKSRIGNKDYEGYHVIQAKYKDSSESKDWEWAKQQFQKEMEKFKDTKRDLPTPEVYMFFTNIQFTAVSKVGGRDKIDEFIKEYKDFIPNIIIFGCDEIYKLLDNNRDVSTTYASFILPGDILQEIYTFIKSDNLNNENILYRFLNKEFEEDMYSKLEQAGKVTDESVNLEKVFVDLTISGESLSEDEKFVNFCMRKGDKAWKNKQFKMVFIGGPGQGKSTVTQFLTQIYRVNFLNTFSNKTLSQDVRKFEKNIDKNIQPNCYRFPIKIVLSDYSEWLYKQKENNLSSSIITYIQDRITYRADEEFNSFRELLTRLSFLFIFDGLDEVPSTSNRSDVILEIDNFINHELTTVNCDAMIIATTRPQGYSNEFCREKGFYHFELNDMDNKTCIEYLEGLVKNTIASNDERVKQLKILKDALGHEVTADIMRTPLQATIMAILVKSGGKPSKDKFSLFDDYYHTMLKREKQKNILTIISEHEDYINEIHYKLGDELQVSSQKKENSSALMDKKDFQILVEKYFTNQGLTSDDIARYTKEIMEAITERLVFITEKQDNKIGFAIRSTQEYFSAMMNVHNISDEKVIKNMKNISQSIYWRNVFIFMLGYIAKKKTYILDNLDSFIGELNGSTLTKEEDSLSKLTHYGSLLSLNILSEYILTNRPKEENKFIHHLEQLTNIIALNNSSHLLQKLKPAIINTKMQDILMQGVQYNELSIRMSSWNIIAILSSTNNEYINQFLLHWTNDKEEELYCLKKFIDNNVYVEFILEKSLKYLNWDDTQKFINTIYEEDFFDTLAKSKKLTKNKIAKNFLIEFIFLKNNYYPFDKEGRKIFFKLLDINTDNTLDFLENTATKISETDTFNINIMKIKDLNNHQVLKKLHQVTLNNKGLPLLTTFISYLLNPSSKTLKNLFIEIKLKSQDNNHIGIETLICNWQLQYIVDAIRKNLTKEKVFITIDKFGKTYDDFKKYENQFNNLYNICEEDIHLNIIEKNEKTSDQQTIKFYEEIFIKNKSAYSDELLQKFIFDARDIKNIKQYKVVIDEVHTIINAKTNKNILIEISKVALIAFTEKNELKNLFTNSSIDFNFHFRSILHILGSNTIEKIVKNILNLLTFEEKENDFIIIIFNILTNERFSKINKDDYTVLYNLTYTNHELKIYGFLSSLVSPDIHENEDNMKIITNFLLKHVNVHKSIFDDTLNIILANNLKGDLIEDLLFKMYHFINKNSIENCILASRYENAFQDMFENRVIGLKDYLD